MSYIELFASLSVTEFRAFKKALRTLIRAGVERATAVQILLDAIQVKHDCRERERLYRTA